MSVQIVTIEDIDEISDLLQVVLTHPDVTIHRADNGQDGLDLIDRITPDVVILDIMMPGMDGWAVYDRLRANPAYKTLPVIVISVLDQMPERRQQFEASDIDHYFTKPFDTVTLRHLIGRLVKRPDLWA